METLSALVALCVGNPPVTLGYSISQEFMHMVVGIGFNHMREGYFTGSGAVIRLAQFQWSNPEEYE